MKKKILVALCLIVLLVGTFALRLIDTVGLYLFDAIVCAISVFGAFEFSKLLNIRGIKNSTLTAAVVPVFVFAGHTISFALNLEAYLYAIILVSIFVLAFVATTLGEMFAKKEGFKNALKVGGATLLTYLYPTLLLVALMLLNRFDILGGKTTSIFGGNLSWVALVLTFLIPVISDTFAMFCGMLFKGPKLCPKISPNKTISGSVCGILLTSGVCAGSFFIFNLFETFSVGFAQLGIQFWHFLLLGFFGSIVSQIGDLFESHLKRKAGVKDSSNLIPGHGGFLDRFDSHIFNAPFVLLFFVLLILV